VLLKKDSDSEKQAQVLVENLLQLWDCQEFKFNQADKANGH